MEHKEAYELLDAYVFGTLTEAERQDVEKHLETKCAECYARLREVGEVSVELAAGLKRTLPPSDLNLSLMERIGKTTVIPEAPERSKRAEKATGFSLYQALAITGAVAVVALSFWNVSLNSRITNLQNKLADSSDKLEKLVADNSIQNDATILLGKPCTRLVDLAGVEPNPQAFAKLFLHPDEDFGVFYAYQMPTAPEGREYQAWIKRDGITQSVGVFTVQENGSALIELRGLPKVPTIDSFMVTIEPVGGVESPTGMMYLLGYNTLSKTH